MAKQCAAFHHHIRRHRASVERFLALNSVAIAVDGRVRRCANGHHGHASECRRSFRQERSIDQTAVMLSVVPDTAIHCAPDARRPTPAGGHAPPRNGHQNSPLRHLAAGDIHRCAIIIGRRRRAWPRLIAISRSTPTFAHVESSGRCRASHRQPSTRNSPHGVTRE